MTGPAVTERHLRVVALLRVFPPTHVALGSGLGPYDLGVIPRDNWAGGSPDDFRQITFVGGVSPCADRQYTDWTDWLPIDTPGLQAHFDDTTPGATDADKRAYVMANSYGPTLDSCGQTTNEWEETEPGVYFSCTGPNNPKCWYVKSRARYYANTVACIICLSGVQTITQTGTSSTPWFANNTYSLELYNDDGVTSFVVNADQVITREGDALPFYSDTRTRAATASTTLHITPAGFVEPT